MQLNAVEKTFHMRIYSAAQLLRSVVNPLNSVIFVIGVIFVVIMMLTTTADVIMRYIFNSPITGVQETIELMMIVSFAFSVAYTGYKKRHIILDLVTQHLTPRIRATVNFTTCLLTIGFFGLLAWRSIVYADSLRSSMLTTSILYIPKDPFAYILAFGAILFCLVLISDLLENLAKLVEGIHWSRWAGLLIIVVLVVVLFSIPVWEQGLRGQVSPITAGVIGIAMLLVLMSSGMLIGLVMAIPGFLGMAYVVGTLPALSMMGSSPFSQSSSYTMSQVPLFVLMGLLCFHSNLSRELYDAAYKWFGRLPGGLAITSIGAATAFGAVCGSTIAETATITTVALPEMKKHRYSASFASAVVAAGGGIGSLIPPSICMVLYGMLTDQSVGKLYIAGIIPGILQAFLYMLLIYVMCKGNPLIGPPGEGSRLIEKLSFLKGTWGVLALFLLVIGGIYFGIFTPTEAAGVGAFGALILAISRRQLTWKGFTEALLETGQTTGMAILLLIGAAALGYFIAAAKLPFALSEFVAGMGFNRYIIFAVIVVFYLFLGSFLSSIAMLVLTVPIIFPIIESLGFDPIWFGIQVVIFVELATITPPYALNIFIVHGIASEIPLSAIYRGVIPFIGAAIFEIVILTVFPQIVTFLPDLMK